MRRLLILLCLVLCLLSLWLMRTALGMKEPVSAPQAVAAPPASVPKATPPKTAKAPAPRKPLRITSKSKVRLRPAESAVLGYWEIAPGMNGMAMVTPETTPEGHVKMTAKLLHLSDAAVSKADAHDLFPDLFDFENASAIGPERLSELQSSLQKSRGVDLLSMPTVLSRPGQPASISLGNANDAMLTLGLQADPVAEDGGYDLHLELQRQE